MRTVDLPKHAQAQRLRREATKAERLLWSRLKNRALGGHKFVRQEVTGPYFPDFVCRERMFIVEVDGATHSTDVEKAKDAARERFLRAEGYRIIRVQNADIYENLDGVCAYILMMLEERDTL
jgi:very-short-patch-repair endonuclease